MTPFITDIPVHEFSLRRAEAIEMFCNFPQTHYTSEIFEKTYFLLTEKDIVKTTLPKSITVSSLFPDNYISTKTLNVLSISNLIFANSKPLKGKELDVLNKTFKRLLSKTPTKF